ncbi:MAG: hypothetical protein LBM23_10780 [Propionibacteriaceae bacterium]|jgi:uncharacterized protein YukE|nr:hypothetical protein [Propionibacteriaceae bacterium]
MTESMFGADVDQLRSLAQQFETAVTELEQATVEVERGIQSQFWAGPVAVRFKASWEQSHRVKIEQAAGAVANAAQALRTNADEQEATSNESGGSNAGASGGGPSTPRAVAPETCEPDSKQGSDSDAISILGGFWQTATTAGQWAAGAFKGGKAPDLESGFGAIGLLGSGLSLMGDAVGIADAVSTNTDDDPCNDVSGLGIASLATGTAGDLAGAGSTIAGLAGDAGEKLVPGFGIAAGALGAISSGIDAYEAFQSGDTVSGICNVADAVGNVVSAVGSAIPPPAGLAVSVVGGAISGISNVIDFFW